MDPADVIRVRHMLAAAQEAVGFAAGRQRAQLDHDRMLVLAVVKALEIIGEAASKISPAAREATPNVPWQAIIGMRNRLIHGYFDINLDIVWTTVTDELPPPPAAHRGRRPRARSTLRYPAWAARATPGCAVARRAMRIDDGDKSASNHRVHASPTNSDTSPKNCENVHAIIAAPVGRAAAA